MFETGSAPLKCYSGGSLYMYLRNIFLSFGFPDLSEFISLLPQTRKTEVIYKNTYLKLKKKVFNIHRCRGWNPDICVLTWVLLINTESQYKITYFIIKNLLMMHCPNGDQKFFLFFLVQLLNTISPPELSQFLSQPSVINNNSDICVIFNNYNNTPAFLETVFPSSESCHIRHILNIKDTTFTWCSIQVATLSHLIKHVNICLCH